MDGHDILREAMVNHLWWQNVIAVLWFVGMFTLAAVLLVLIWKQN